MDAELFKLLRDTEAKQNEGRGVQCVKSVLTYIGAGKMKDAEAVVDWDHDKLRSYPDIQRVLADIFPKYNEWLHRDGELFSKEDV
jgi:hypothetical protein